MISFKSWFPFSFREPSRKCDLVEASIVDGPGYGDDAGGHSPTVRLVEESAFRDFINALCQISREMVTVQSEVGISIAPVRTSESGDDVGSSLNVSTDNVSQRRRIILYT